MFVEFSFRTRRLKATRMVFMALRHGQMFEWGDFHAPFKSSPYQGSKNGWACAVCVLLFSCFTHLSHTIWDSSLWGSNYSCGLIFPLQGRRSCSQSSLWLQRPLSLVLRATKCHQYNERK